MTVGCVTTNRHCQLRLKRATLANHSSVQTTVTNTLLCPLASVWKKNERMKTTTEKNSSVNSKNEHLVRGPIWKKKNMENVSKSCEPAFEIYT